MTGTHWLLLGALALSACGEDTITIPPPEPPPTGSLQLALSAPGPILANVPASQVANGGVTVTRSAGLTGVITMSAESVPTGWSVTFSPALISGSANTSSVVITAPANIGAGSYSFNVRASVTGITNTVGTMTVVANVEQGN